MIAARNHQQFSGDRPLVFLLQDNKGFHVFVQHPLTKKRQRIKHEETIADNKRAGGTLIIERPEFSPKFLNSSRQGRIVTFCASNNMLQSQTSSPLSTRLRRSQSPSLSAARTINYYFSTGMLHVSEQNVLPILEISLQLGLSVIQEACTLLLSKTLTARNWSEILRLAQDYHSRSLSNTFTKLTRQYIAKCLTRGDLISLIGTLTHSRTDQQSLNFFFKRFLQNGNKKNVIKFTYDLFRSEAKMLQFCFKDCLESDSKVKAIQDVDKNETAYQQVEKRTESTTTPLEQETLTTLDSPKHVAAKARTGKDLLSKHLDKTTVKFITPLHTSTTLFSPENTWILIAGGITNEHKPEATNRVFMFCQSSNQWVKLPSMNSKRYNHSIVNIRNNVIAIGGNTAPRDSRVSKMRGSRRMTKSVSDTLYRRSLLEPSQTNSVEQLSIKNDVDEWSTAYSMILSREEHCSVVVGEQVYTIGGHDGICQLCSVERFNPMTNRWSLEKPMSRLRTGASAVTDGRYIYVIGGYGGLQWLNTIECYDTATKTWSRDYFPPMAERRGYACAEMLDHDIYVIGGTNGHESLKTCEVFNTQMKEWRRGPTLKEPRLNAAHCVLNGKILVLGGECHGSFLDTVEQLDVVAWDWKPFCRLPVKLAGLKCTVMCRK